MNANPIIPKDPKQDQMKLREELLDTISLAREYLRTLSQLYYKEFYLVDSSDDVSQISATIDDTFSEWMQQMKKFELLHHRLRETTR